MKFSYNFGWKSIKAVNRFQKRIKQGKYFPAFLFISVTNRCNLSCQGCWVSPTKPALDINLVQLNNIIEQSKSQGSYFFGILGGEPLLFKGLLELCAYHSDCYFLLFTNGTLITQEIAAKMHDIGNISPLISIEGNEIISDERRGATRVYNRTIDGLNFCREHGLITGVATSVCKSNFNDLVSEKFLHQLIELGVHYHWYYVYRPVGPNPMPDLALSTDEVIALRKFIVAERKKAPILIVDSYWDHKGRAMCPAATGISHHISPNGDIEPCPPIQFAKDHIHNGRTLYDIFTNSEFLSEFRDVSIKTTRGCILMERPDILIETMKNTNARDSSGRGTALAELAAMHPRSSHHTPGNEIPETYWPYKFAKKYWFFGFGAYG